MFDTICTYPLTSDVFTQTVHPSEPLLAVGLSTGHVETFRLPAVTDHSDAGASDAETGRGTVESAWKTRRHKGSCRCLAYSVDGEALYSAGTDGILKAASATTGQVTSKLAIPRDSTSSELDPPTLVHAPSPQTLLLATDSSALHLYDLRASTTFASPQKAQQTYRPHDDYISSLTPLPPSDTSTSGFSKQWVTTGGSTLAVTDLRRGVLVKSEDQEEELLASVFVGGVSSKRGRAEKVVVGGAGGVLTLWERGVWDDQDERIRLDQGPHGGESIDAMVLLPETIGTTSGTTLATGLGDGTIKLVRLGANKVANGLQHDEVEGVIGLNVDVGGRLISGGGQVLKVWGETVADELEDQGDETCKNGDHSGDEVDGSGFGDEDGSSEEETPARKRRKRKRNSKRDSNSGQPVLGFKGLD